MAEKIKLTELLELIGSGKEVIYLDRSGAATCAYIAALVRATGKTVVLAGFDEEESRRLAALVRIFQPNLSAGDIPAERPAWDRPLLRLPAMRRPGAKEGWPARMAALYALAKGGARCVVASTNSLLIKYMPRDFFDSRTLEIAVGADLAPELIVEQAVDWGYERVAMVTQPGELARRGDILDIFLAGYSRPARIEFFGDTIEEARLFDVDSQRSLKNLEEITLIPRSPIPLDARGAAAAAARFDSLRAAGKLTENEAYSLKRRVGEDGRDVLPGLVYEKATLFEDWLPKDCLWILPGEADSAEKLRSARLTMKEEIEKEENEVPQPAGLALRRSLGPAPWNGKRRIFLEPLRVGVEETGIALPEKDFQSFSALFPLESASDRPWQTLMNGVREWRKSFDQILFVFSTERGRKKFLALAAEDGLTPFTRYSPEREGIYALISPYGRGAELSWLGLMILGEDIIYPRAEKRARKTRAFKGLDDFDSLKPGELLVHRDYGIGRFDGLHRLAVNGVSNDFLLVEYAGSDKLYVPVDRLGLIQRFRGQEGFVPVLDKLGGQAWNAGKEKARKAIEKIAADLVETYAYRKVAKGYRYDPPGELYHEFEATFGFEETPDQARAIGEVLGDMEKDAPMDRLICGDVGFGKTEVALRAAFRAASEGRQVALLCPTTVLAEQHYQTFRSRLAGFPVNVGLLSRFVPRAKQKEVLQGCEKGQIDILVGTHRMLSNDVKLPNLSLLILDEEQRFGVRHKEKLRSIKKNVDTLTLTATPIPRTLQLSMSGIRDLSIIETPPADRKPVASAIIQRDDITLREALARELKRGGQVFWVYNRVRDLDRVLEYVKKLAPEARVAMAHGQMPEKELETVMRKFWHKELDILVCTSIVESGLDFPGANTLIVDQAQMFGLGQLYQLRGRVGRADKQAYAYFVVPDSRKLNDVARERLRIILDMDYLGAGFQVAMEDLRLRGAGNILGEAQSGHITRVGLDLYLEMLEEAVAKIKGEPAAIYTEPEINMGVSAHIPETWVADGRERLRYYKALSSARDAREREETELAMRDRFGQFPEEFQNFLAMLDYKEFLGKLRAEKADIGADSIKLVWSRDQTAIAAENILKLVTENPEIKLAPPATLIMPLDVTAPFPERLAKTRTLLESLLANNDKTGDGREPGCIAKAE